MASKLDTEGRNAEDPGIPCAPTVPSLHDFPEAPPGQERFDVLHQHRGVVIERIASSGSQPAETYCQQHDEWVLLVRGSAQVRVNDAVLPLVAGSYLHLPASTPHEVLSTSHDALWLAVHVRER